MKNVKYFKAIILATTLLITSCENRLDKEQELTTGSSFDYSSADKAKGALIGSYAKFQNMGWANLSLISVRGDDVNAGGLGDQVPFSDTDRFTYDNSFWMYNALWADWYQKIVDITTTIEELDKFKAGGVNPNLINQYQAECKVLRAFALLEISRVWGKVILMETTDQTQLKLKSKDEIMQWISSQMDEAAPNLLDMRPNERTDLKGGVTKYTALAVKAMANLELKNYQAVADATGSIINSGKFSLYVDYYHLFKTAGKLTNESLLEVQYSYLGNSSGNSSTFDGGDFYGPQNWTPAIAGVATGGWGFYEPSLKYIKFMLGRGERTRLETGVLFTNRGIGKIKEDPNYATLPSWISNTTQDGDVINDYTRAMFASGKHYLPSKEFITGRTGPYGGDKNLIITRYSEILLMYAEAVARGATATAGTADSAVNTVRTRAGLSTLTGVTADQVMDEKYAELGMEWGIRYFDMVRLGNTAALSYDGRTFTMDKQFLPYPLAQLDKINSLK